MKKERMFFKKQSQEKMAKRIVATTKEYLADRGKKNVCDLRKYLQLMAAETKAELAELDNQRHHSCGGKNISHRKMYENIVIKREQLTVLNMSVQFVKKNTFALT